MFTPQEKERVCAALWNYECSKAVEDGWYDAHPVPPTTWEMMKADEGWLVNPKAIVKRVLQAMEPYYSRFDLGIKEYVLADLEDEEALADWVKMLPASILSFMFHDTWQTPETQLQPVGSHIVVSEDKLSVSFYTDAEWIECQKTLK
jgi:hypothetical protein